MRRLAKFGLILLIVVASLLVLGALAATLVFGAKTFRAPSESMVPTVDVGDRLVTTTSPRLGWDSLVVTRRSPTSTVGTIDSLGARKVLAPNTSVAARAPSTSSEATTISRISPNFASRRIPQLFRIGPRSAIAFTNPSSCMVVQHSNTPVQWGS